MDGQELAEILQGYGVYKIEHVTSYRYADSITESAMYQVSIEMSQTALVDLATTLSKLKEDAELREQFPTLQRKYEEYLILRKLYEGNSQNNSEK